MLCLLKNLIKVLFFLPPPQTKLFFKLLRLQNSNINSAVKKVNVFSPSSLLSPLNSLILKSAVSKDIFTFFSNINLSMKLFD